jgi:hypothetical protein
LQSLILFWLVEMPKIRGGKQTVVSGAHRLDLACLLFDDLAPILEEYYGAKIVKSYGRYQATMPDGSKWWVKALKPNQGHGMSIDLVCVDELFAGTARTQKPSCLFLLHGWHRRICVVSALARGWHSSD